MPACRPPRPPPTAAPSPTAPYSPRQTGGDRPVPRRSAAYSKAAASCHGQVSDGCPGNVTRLRCGREPRRRMELRGRWLPRLWHLWGGGQRQRRLRLPTLDTRGAQEIRRPAPRRPPNSPRPTTRGGRLLPGRHRHQVSPGPWWPSRLHGISIYPRVGRQARDPVRRPTVRPMPRGSASGPSLRRRHPAS